VTSRSAFRGRLARAGTAALIAGVALVGCATSTTETDTASASDKPVAGGAIVAALAGDPQTLDSGVNTGSLTISVASNIFEQLFALDADFVVRPMLADSYEVSDDGLVYTVALREDVPFHNGEIMDSADVKASLDRWFEVSSTGMATAANVASVDTPDASTIVFTLAKPSYSFIGAFAATVQAAIILPAEIAEAAGSSPLTNEQIIGTGPYALAEYAQGTSVSLERFEDYSSRDDAWGGAAGAKAAYADTIQYVFVPDATQRLNGLKTGQWNWVQSISADDMEATKLDDSISIVPGPTGLVNTLLMNENENSVFADVDARQALNKLVDKQSIAEATFGSEEVWAPLSPAMVVKTNTAMYSDAGEDVFNDFDPEGAKELFADAGLEEGDTVRILTSQTYAHFYAMTVMLQAEFEAIGINAELEVYDFPTMIDRLSSAPTEWDISITSFNGAVSAPNQILWLGDSWPGEYQSDEMDALVASYEDVLTPEDASAVVDDIQELVYEEMPVVQLGSTVGVGVFSADLHPLDAWTGYLWNTWLSE
jgi:peptide/nickel transport system substrate-binding protein